MDIDYIGHYFTVRFDLQKTTNKLIILISSVFLVHLAIPTLATPYQLGLNYNLISQGGLLGFYRLFTPILVHGSFLHVAMNMFSLYNVGNLVEQLMGRGKYIILILATTLGGSLAVYLFSDRNALTIGASGMIFGLLGSLLTLESASRINKKQLYFIVGLNMLFTFSIPGVSWQGHVGGLLTGVLMGKFLSSNA